MSIFHLILFPIALMYCICSRVRSALGKKYKSLARVLCIGNITVGGAGKTQIALHLGKILKERGVKFCYVSRGYGGIIKNPTKVMEHHSPEDIRDEALLLRDIGDVYIGKNRKNVIKFAESHGYDVIIMDDGMQNNAAHKDFTALVIDGEYGFGNEYAFPMGPMREGFKHGMKKSDCVIFIGHDNNNIESRILNGKEIFHAETMMDCDIDRDVKYVAFAGIGIPEKFFSFLRGEKVSLCETFAFPDHHVYKDHEIEELIEIAHCNGCKLITTSKDYVKLRYIYKAGIVECKVNIKLDEEERFFELIERIIIPKL